MLDPSLNSKQTAKLPQQELAVLQQQIALLKQQLATAQQEAQHWQELAAQTAQETQQVEAQLLNQQQFFRSVYDGVEHVIFVWNITPEGQVLHGGWNAACEAATGMKTADVIGKPPEAIFGAEQGTTIRQNMLRCAKQKTSLRYEECLTFQEQDTWWLTTLNPLTNEQGRIYRIIGTTFNITDRKETEAVLRSQELQYRNIFENVTDGIVILDLKTGNPQTANIAYCEMFDYSLTELKNMSALDMVHPDYQALLTESFQTIEMGEQFFAEAICIRKDGMPFDVEIRATPYWRKGELCSLSVLRDISDRKYAERTLAQQMQLTSLRAAIVSILTRATTLKEMLQYCAEALVTHLDAAFARIWLLNPAENVLELQVSAGMYTHTDGAHRRIPVGQFKIGLIAQERKPHLTNNVLIDPRVSDKDWAKREGMVAFAGYPLFIDGNIQGVMAMFSRTALSDLTLESLSFVATEIALGLKRVHSETALRQSEKQLREQAQREQLLNRLTTQIRNSLNLNDVLATTVRELYRLLHLNFCAFAWYYPNLEEQTWQIIQEAKSLDMPSAIGTYSATLIGPIESKLLRQEIIQIDDADRYEEPIHRDFLKRSHIRSRALVPIQTQREQLGIIICDRNYLQAWSAGEIELLKAVADQLAIAIDQAELYSKMKSKSHALEQALEELKRTQAQMIQSEKMSGLGQLVAGIAHEINNPVNFIHGNLTPAQEYIQDLLYLIELYQAHYPQPVPEIEAEIEAIDLDFLNEDLHKLLLSMRTGTERIREIVLSLRNFSRLDEAEMKAVDIHEGINSTLMVLQSRLKASPNQPDIQVIQAYHPLPLVECYAGQLNQVFMNILVNAIDALEEKIKPRPHSLPPYVPPQPLSYSPTITIRTSQLAPDWIQIAISDNGDGMSEFVRQRVFDPFFTTKPVGKGTGMGMSISYQIVTEKHQGKLICNSTPGQGTEFLIQIPVEPGKRLNQENTEG